MAVSTVTPLLKSQPDYAKLNAFSGCVVTVTRHTAARGTVGHNVLPTQKMSKDAVLALMTHLPLQYGAGFYHFTVADEGGGGEDSWMVKLGSGEPQQEPFMSGPNGVPPNPGAPQALGEGVIHLGHNFFYNEAMGTLTTPWRTIVSWKQGDPMPQPPTSPAAQPSHLSLVPPNASPWWGQPQQGGWGGYPVNDGGVEAKLKAVEAQLAEERQRRREDDQRVAMERLQAETRQMVADSNARFEKLIEKLATKPAGESPELIAIRQQNEALQRQMENERRDREAQARDAATREEMRRNREDTDRLVRELAADKTDPMLPMIMQMIGQSNQNAMEAIKAIQSTTATANSSNERQVQQLVEQMRGTITSPLQMMQMMQTARGDGADMAKMMLETTKDTMAMQRNVFEQLLEVAGSGSQPAWLQAVEALANKVGPIGEALAARANQPKVVVQRVPVPVDAATGRPIVTPPPAANPQLAGAAGVAPAPGPTHTEIRNTDANGVAAGGKKRGGKKAKKAEKMTLAEIRDMDPDELAESLRAFPDEVLFGETLFGAVKLLRENVAKGAVPEQVAGSLWDRRMELQAITPIPMAVELFMAEQISVLVERLLPGTDEKYQDRVIEVLEERFEAEAEGAEEATE